MFLPFFSECVFRRNRVEAVTQSGFQKEFLEVGTLDKELQLRTLIAWANANFDFLHQSSEFIKTIAKKSNRSAAA